MSQIEIYNLLKNGSVLTVKSVAKFFKLNKSVAVIQLEKLAKLNDIQKGRKIVNYHKKMYKSNVEVNCYYYSKTKLYINE